jgi:predicted DNA-binding transcriptional regulator AlpA
MQYLPGRQVRDRYHVSDMTLWRWMRSPKLKFPHPTVINRRRYWLLDELETWERANVSKAAGAKSA